MGFALFWPCLTPTCMLFVQNNAITTGTFHTPCTHTHIARTSYAPRTRRVLAEYSPSTRRVRGAYAVRTSCVHVLHRAQRLEVHIFPLSVLPLQTLVGDFRTFVAWITLDCEPRQYVSAYFCVCLEGLKGYYAPYVHDFTHPGIACTLFRAHVLRVVRTSQLTFTQAT